jgi:hypothetical protein
MDSSLNFKPPTDLQTMSSKTTPIDFDPKMKPQLPTKTIQKTTHCSWWWLCIPILFLLFISFAGPWYHDCDATNCQRQRNYGLYCDDYCIYGYYGPGTSTGGSIVVLFLFGMLLCFYPFGCVANDKNRLWC